MDTAGVAKDSGNDRYLGQNLVAHAAMDHRKTVAFALVVVRHLRTRIDHVDDQRSQSACGTCIAARKGPLIRVDLI